MTQTLRKTTCICFKAAGENILFIFPFCSIALKIPLLLRTAPWKHSLRSLLKHGSTATHHCRRHITADRVSAVVQAAVVYRATVVRSQERATAAAGAAACPTLRVVSTPWISEWGNPTKVMLSHLHLNP